MRQIGLAATAVSLLSGQGLAQSVTRGVEADDLTIRIVADQTQGAPELIQGFVDAAGTDEARRLRSIVSLNSTAVRDARAESRANGGIRRPLKNVPILIKDNVETADPMATTAGSLALKDNITRRDAPLVARLRAAGAVILGKTNLSEWANIRSSHSISGWSAVGGLTRNPYALDRNACGSSSGSAVAVAAGLAVAAVGTETDGSITCPASVNGIVGLKPTVGLVSRTRIIPISASQDTAGPMARTVEDSAILLTVMAGSDPADPATREADAHKTDYAAALRPDALKGSRLGVYKRALGHSPATDAVFAQAVAALKAQGATVVELDDKPHDGLGEAELTVLLTELKVGLNAYLATTDAKQVKVRTLADVIAFNRVTPREMALFGQDLFEKAEATHGLTDPAYLKARADSLRWAKVEGLDRMFARDKLDAVIGPTTSPAWRSDVVDGDNGAESMARLPAIAGYPHLTVPMGQVRGLPVGISFIGPAWSEAKLLAYGYAFEQATHARQPPTFRATIDEGPDVEPSR